MRIRLARIAALVATLACLFLAVPSAPAVEGAVDVNRATAEELVALPGIGPAKAQAIIEYREQHPFQSIDELRNVRGIGEHTFETLKDKIRVGAAEAESAKR